MMNDDIFKIHSLMSQYIVSGLEPDLLVFKICRLGVINSQVLKIIKEMFAHYTCELLLESSRKPGVLCIHLPKYLMRNMQSIQNLSLLGYFPKSHLSPDSSWPRPR